MLARPTKICTRCKTEKTFEGFHGRKTAKDGKTSECKACHRVGLQAYRDRVRNGTQLRRWSPYDPNATTKICPNCKIEKAFSEFAPDKTKRHGVSHTCKLCFRDYMSERWRTNPDHRAKGKARSRRNYEEPESRAKFMIANARKRRPDGFSLTFEHVVAGIKAGFCPITGIKFDLTDAHERATGRSRNPYSPSLDRIDSRLGYTDENSRIVSTQYNIMKGELSDSEMFYLCRLIATRNPA